MLKWIAFVSLACADRDYCFDGIKHHLENVKILENVDVRTATLYIYIKDESTSNLIGENEKSRGLTPVDSAPVHYRMEWQQPANYIKHDEDKLPVVIAESTHGEDWRFKNIPGLNELSYEYHTCWKASFNAFVDRTQYDYDYSKRNASVVVKAIWDNMCEANVTTNVEGKKSMQSYIDKHIFLLVLAAQ